MRKWKMVLAALTALLIALGSAGAEGVKAPDFVLEGFDGGSANHDWESNLFFQRMQESTGVSFEFRQHTDEEEWASRKSAILKGEDLPDVLFKAGLNDTETLAMAEAGVLLDLTPYLQENAPDLWALLEAHPEWKRAITLPDGTIRALPSLNELPANNLIWINRSWVDLLKMEMPRTAEELTEVLRAFKTRDPNRNGQGDEVPLSVLGMWDLKFLGHAFGLTDNDYYISLQDGEVTSGLLSDRNRAFLTWLHQLWTEGLLSHTSFSTADSLRQITDAKATMTYGVFLSSSPMNVVPAEALSQYTALMPLEYEGEQKYRDLLGTVTRGTFAVTSGCKDPAKVVAWVNRLYTEEGSILMQVGREGEEYMWLEDGSWEWMADLQTVANEVLPGATLSDGGVAPGIITMDFQLKYAETRTRDMMLAMKGVQQYARLPFPQVILSAEDQEKLDRLQAQISSFAEKRMAEFVTGDAELNDETWASFRAEIESRGFAEMIAIWQKYVK